MSMNSWITLGVIVIVSVVAFLTSYRKQPRIGLVICAAVIAFFLLFRKEGLEAVALSAPKSWLFTALWGLGLGIGLAFIFLLAVEPFIDNSLDKAWNAAWKEKVRGNWKQLLLLLGLAWVVGAVLEELVFRGFLILSIESLITKNGVYASITLLISALIYGAANWHTGQNGIFRAIILGLILGDIFIWSGYNLWMPILAHGFFETTSLVLVFLNAETKIRSLLWKEKTDERRKRTPAKNR